MPPPVALPAPTAPGGCYSAVVIHAGFAHVSGQLPRVDGQLAFCGRVGADLDLEQARAAARLCALQCLAALDQALGGLDRIERLIKVTGYVACTAGFTALPAVIDAASECFVEMLGAAGAHARSSIGVHQLPRGAPVEVELVAALREVS